MIVLLQIVLYCLLFMLLVKCAARNSGRNCLYFYSDEYLAEAQKRGLADIEETKKKAKGFMIPFCIILFIVLILFIAVWNHVTDYKTAYIQTVLFLVVMNWFDGIVIDRIWVGHSKIWKIEGMEGVPYVHSWKAIMKKRSIATVSYLIIAFAVAGLIVLIGKI